MNLIIILKNWTYKIFDFVSPPSATSALPVVFICNKNEQNTLNYSVHFKQPPTI